MCYWNWEDREEKVRVFVMVNTLSSTQIFVIISILIRTLMLAITEMAKCGVYHIIKRRVALDFNVVVCLIIVVSWWTQQVVVVDL